MVVQCPKCKKKYKIDSSKVTEKGAKITCPNCSNVFVVRKKSEEEPKEDYTPCSVCGQSATQGVDTGHPLCDQCAAIEAEKSARFMPMGEEEGTSPDQREIDLKGSSDFSFDELSGGDYAPQAYSTEVLPHERPSETGDEEPKSVDEDTPSKKEPEDFFEGTGGEAAESSSAAPEPAPPQPRRVSQVKAEPRPSFEPPKSGIESAPSAPSAAPEKPRQPSQPSEPETSAPPKPPEPEAKAPPPPEPPRPDGSSVGSATFSAEPASSSPEKAPASEKPPPPATEDGPKKGTQPGETEKYPAGQEKPRKTSPAPLVLAIILLSVLLAYILLSVFGIWSF